MELSNFDVFCSPIISIYLTFGPKRIIISSLVLCVCMNYVCPCIKSTMAIVVNSALKRLIKKACNKCCNFVRLDSTMAREFDSTSGVQAFDPS